MEIYLVHCHPDRYRRCAVMSFLAIEIVFKRMCTFSSSFLWFFVPLSLCTFQFLKHFFGSWSRTCNLVYSFLFAKLDRCFIARLKVSEVEVDGCVPLSQTRFAKRGVAESVPVVDMDWADGEHETFGFSFGFSFAAMSGDSWLFGGQVHPVQRLQCHLPTRGHPALLAIKHRAAEGLESQLYRNGKETHGVHTLRDALAKLQSTL